MTVDVQLAPLEKRYVLQNMWIAYAHELSEFHNDLPSSHGLMGEHDDEYDPETFMAEWWAHPGGTFVYFIYVDARLAGFALIAAPPLVDGDADKELSEFFLFHAYRGQGVGFQAATALFNLFPGSWQLSVMDNYVSTMRFWEKTLASYTNNPVTKKSREENGVPLTEFRFSSP